MHLNKENLFPFKNQNMNFLILIVYIQCAEALIGTDFGKIYNQMVSRKLNH